MTYARRALLWFLASTGFVFPAAAAPPTSCGTLNAGLQILTNVPALPGGSDYAGALKMAVWYPTTAQALPYTYSGPRPDLSGLAALNAPPATCSQFPLIVFSHGWSGCGTQSVYLTEQLARLGYIVAAPDHNDHGCSVDGTSSSLLQVFFDFPLTKFGDAATWTDQTAFYRNADVEAVLNYMLNNWSGRSSINPNQIVMSGHSFGGYTAFAKIGGWASWLNPKFKAGILYSPYIQAFQSQKPNTMSSPNVPQIFMTGGPQDKAIEPWVMGPQPCSGVNSENCGQAGAFEQVQALKYYGELPGSGQEASHFAFTNSICTNLGDLTVQSCLAQVPNAQTVVNYTQDFLDHVLFGQKPQRLWSTGPEFATYWQTAGVPAFSYQAGAGSAPDQIVTAIGEQLTTDVPSAANGAPMMPQSIEQTTVTVTDSLRISRPANLYYVSPTQLNIVVPDGTSAGQATIAVEVAGSLVSSGPLTINSGAPSLLMVPGNVLAGWAVNSTSQYIPIWALSGALPLDVSGGGTYLVGLGSGLRGGATLGSTISIGNTVFDGINGPRLVIVPSPSYQGVDQFAIGPLPASLSGAGTVNVVISIGGRSSNAVVVSIQ
ncbi:MAG: alpha/beta hydrolase [Bryobacterales bacterium]|nr:alpha/beta hydrolase [Bryobacterales bacterium]MBV9400733.1 alpha/beta hydrolase [Bryobacterales bacterium]